MTVSRTDQHLFEDTVFQIGLGTYSLTGGKGTETIQSALEYGYRHVDTARLYENERNVGDALTRADVDREDVLVATKVGHFEEPEKTPTYIQEAVTASLDRLGVDTIDLLYHHWPRDESEVETVLPVFDKLVDEGLVANVGVSNYPIRYLEMVSTLIDAPLVANQVEMHPLLQQQELYAYLQDQDMTLVAYSPLAQGEVFDVPDLVEIAEKHETTAAAVSLAWLAQKEGVVPIPRSSKDAHIQQNLDTRTLSLDAEDIETIESLNKKERLEDPPWMTW
ncbi:aldo/keto reductase [Haladaptatus caseinilyticus]|uniref:aldo/keto reductase n=1 Tax=Haladaptatus caseinilyticus TaxID=2993314 RepID=UPI00224B871D|nr:aldo/keto reductase [Haladaptatus caseinilyticus]